MQGGMLESQTEHKPMGEEKHSSQAKKNMREIILLSTLIQAIGDIVPKQARRFRENCVGFSVVIDRLLITKVYSSCDGARRGNGATWWSWRAETDSTWKICWR